MLHSVKKTILRFLFCFLATMAIAAPASSFAEDALDKIREELHNSSWQARLAAVEKLDKRCDKEALDILMDVAGTWTEKWPVKVKAIEYLGEARYQESTELLLRIFNNPILNWECPAIKSYTATALGNFKGNQEVVDTLISGTGDGELLVREASVRSLGRIGDPKAAPYLVKLLEDQNVSIRLSAIKALSEIGDPGTISDIQDVLKREQDSVVRNEALMALNCFHEKSKTD
jgi:HEAT repeat protein